MATGMNWILGPTLKWIIFYHREWSVGFIGLKRALKTSVQESVLRILSHMRPKNVTKFYWTMFVLTKFPPFSVKCWITYLIENVHTSSVGRVSSTIVEMDSQNMSRITACIQKIFIKKVAVISSCPPRHFVNRRITTCYARKIVPWPNIIKRPTVPQFPSQEMMKSRHTFHAWSIPYMVVIL